MRLTKNFTKSEFDSKCGRSMPIEVLKNIAQLAFNLQVLRDSLNVPIRVNSGYRSPEHNEAIKGAKNSFHVKGMAVDISSSQASPKLLHDELLRLMNQGKIIKGGLKQYNTFVHYDIRGRYATW